MKKIILMGLAIGVLAMIGCTVEPETEQERFYDAELDAVIYSVGDINKWVHYNISYVPDLQKWGMVEYWQPPEVTMETRSGDCEDYVILFEDLVQYYFKGKPPLHVVEPMPNRYHAISEYKGRIYDPTAVPWSWPREEYSLEILDTYDYDWVMSYIRGYFYLGHSDPPFILGVHP